MPDIGAVREVLVRVSRRYSRAAHEIEDLAHDIIVSALRRGFALDGERFARDLHGSVRRHGAFLARSAGRRRAREVCSATVQPESVDADRWPDVAEGLPLSELSPAVRTTLHLLLLGLEKAELRYALGVSDAALRKRFQALREHAPLARPDHAPPAGESVPYPRRRVQVGIVSRLAAAFGAGGGRGRGGRGGGGGGQGRRILAASDPDGHGLIFSEVLTPGQRSATCQVGAADASKPAKGNPC